MRRSVPLSALAVAVGVLVLVFALQLLLTESFEEEDGQDKPPRASVIEMKPVGGDDSDGTDSDGGARETRARRTSTTVGPYTYSASMRGAAARPAEARLRASTTVEARIARGNEARLSATAASPLHAEPAANGEPAPRERSWRRAMRINAGRRRGTDAGDSYADERKETDAEATSADV